MLEKEGLNAGSYEVFLKAKYRENGDVGSEAAEARNPLKRERILFVFLLPRLLSLFNKIHHGKST